MSGQGHPSGDHGHDARPPADPSVLARLRAPERRPEGVAKVTGAARYVGDRALPGMLVASCLLSREAHARLVRVDATRARALPGVHAVLTGEDVRGVRLGRRLMDQPVLAWERVRFVGDRIAAVAAETWPAAEAALAAIEVELEPLPALLDPEAALAPDAPPIHPDAASYAYLGGTRRPFDHPNVQGGLDLVRDADGLAAVFAGAAHVFEQTYRTPRQHHGSLEPHSSLVWIDEAGTVHVASSNKTPYSLRSQMARALGLPPERIEIETGCIGGDFGGKGYSVDEYIGYFLARATGRPVRAVARGAEEFGALNVRHAAVMHLRTAVDGEGRLLAHEARILFDGGAYAAAKPLPHLALAGGVATMAAYRVPHVRIETRTVYTNTVPAGHVRAPGEVQALFAGESHLDSIARSLGLDPLEFRLRNAVRPGEVGASGARFVETRATDVLVAAGEAIGWGTPLPPDHGRGIAAGVRHVGPGSLPLRLRLHADGRIEVFTALAEVGGGAWAVLRRVVAAVAGVAEERVEVVPVSTAGSPPDPGVGGSRVTHVASRAAELAGGQLREWVEERIPRALPTAPTTATLRDDVLVDTATGITLASFGELVGRLVEPAVPVEFTVVYDGPAHGPGEPGDHDFAAVAVEVAVDRATGTVRVVDAVVAADVGTILNPVAHRGQLEGGFVFGLGGALMEELAVDGGAVTTLSLADFKLPASGDVPPLRVVLLPTAVGPGAFGAKMAGELTNTPVAAAIANAVADAVGVRVTQLPITAERVHRALREAAAGSAAADASTSRSAPV